jgi:hypothetical protein
MPLPKLQLQQIQNFVGFLSENIPLVRAISGQNLVGVNNIFSILKDSRPVIEHLDSLLKDKVNWEADYSAPKDRLFKKAVLPVFSKETLAKEFKIQKGSKSIGSMLTAARQMTGILEGGGGTGVENLNVGLSIAGEIPGHIENLKAIFKEPDLENDLQAPSVDYWTGESSTTSLEDSIGGHAGNLMRNISAFKTTGTTEFPKLISNTLAETRHVVGDLKKYMTTGNVGAMISEASSTNFSNPSPDVLKATGAISKLDNSLESALGIAQSWNKGGITGVTSALVKGINLGAHYKSAFVQPINDLQSSFKNILGGKEAGKSTDMDILDSEEVSLLQNRPNQSVHTDPNAPVVPTPVKVVEPKVQKGYGLGRLFGGKKKTTSTSSDPNESLLIAINGEESVQEYDFGEGVPRNVSVNPGGGTDVFNSISLGPSRPVSVSGASSYQAPTLLTLGGRSLVQMEMGNMEEGALETRSRNRESVHSLPLNGIFEESQSRLGAVSASPPSSGSSLMENVLGMNTVSSASGSLSTEGSSGRVILEDILNPVTSKQFVMDKGKDLLKSGMTVALGNPWGSLLMGLGMYGMSEMKGNSTSDNIQRQAMNSMYMMMMR